MLKKISLLSLPILLFIMSHAYSADTISGKVIGVADGDTITVLHNKTQYKIRLYGIDTPEKAQDFGKRAKQFTSDLVYGKNVKIIQEDIDRYGRIVGMVYIGDTCINEEIVKNGLAWVYQRYCKKDLCEKWLKLEADAKSSGIGLWSHDNPVPPWTFRKGKKAASESSSVQSDKNLIYHGNINSKVFHKSTCSAYNCENCTAIFYSRDNAIETGFRPCGSCKP